MALFGWLGGLLGSARVPDAADTPTAASVSPTDPGSVVDATQVPNDGVVLVYDTIGGKDYEGSGVLISPDEVLTATHVVYTSGVGTATDVQVFSGANGYNLGSEANGTVAHFNMLDDSGGKISLDQTQTDYAIIHLDTPFTTQTNFALLGNAFDATPGQGGTATVSGYPGALNGQQVAYTGQVDVQPGLTDYATASLGPGSSGGPVWITNTDGEPTVVGLTSSYDPTNTSDLTNGNAVQLTGAALSQIESWVAQDDGRAESLSLLDTTANEPGAPVGQAYHGPVAALAEQYINVSADNLNISAHSNNWFIHSGAGEDAIQVQGGTNVLDGGTGSNFLVGGTGTDTFFTDDRQAPASIWDTLVNFHAGDSATVFGVTQAGFTLDWVAGQGAAGYTGLTLHATAAGKPEASVTLSGLTPAALTNGQLTLSFGSTGGSPYLNIHANA